MEEITFYTSVSTIGFNQKPTRAQISDLSYNTVQLTVDDLISKIQSGYCFSNLYNLGKDFKFFGAGVKVNNYIGSYTINIDLDHQPLSMQEQYDRAELKPTFCYESWSNAPDDHRYRFIYVFEDLIPDVQDYKDVYHCLCHINHLNFDPRASSPYQYMNGTGSDAMIIKSGQVYSFKDLNLKFQLFTDWSGLCTKVQKPLINTAKPDYINGFCTFKLGDEDFQTDLAKLSFSQILDKYKHRYRNIQHSPIPYASEDEPMIDLPEDFYEITRRFSLKQGEKGQCVRTKYGEHRKKVLYTNLMVRRLITPDLTPEEMLYDLIYELNYYIDNSDSIHKITIKDLVNVAKQVLTADLTSFQYIRPRNRMVNPKYRQKTGMPTRLIANKANAERHQKRKEEQYTRIGELYDCDATITQNLAVMREFGLSISERTLKNFKKDMGLTRKYAMGKHTGDNAIST